MSSGSMAAGSKKVAIIDYGMGNLFSVIQACSQVGLEAETTASKEKILAADAVVLPGVGAFGDAMKTLLKLDLDGVIRDVAASETPLVGICLGMQLMMTESEEFGSNKGLSIIEGQVRRLDRGQSNEGRAQALKVPQVGWNRINKPVVASNSNGLNSNGWKAVLLSDIPDGEYMYFVHSYYTEPADSSVITSTTEYGISQFCSSVKKGNVFACQFHPERSGHQGLKMYQNLATMLRKKTS